MSTTATPLPSGGLCIQETLKDEQSEVRVHLHRDRVFNHTAVQLIGLRVRSARLGVIYDMGELNCQ